MCLVLLRTFTFTNIIFVTGIFVHLQTGREFCYDLFGLNECWYCPNNCGRKYKRKTHLNRHLKYECGVPKQFKCDVCDKPFTHKESLKTHLGVVHQVIMPTSNSGKYLVWPFKLKIISFEDGWIPEGSLIISISMKISDVVLPIFSLHEGWSPEYGG